MLVGGHVICNVFFYAFKLINGIVLLVVGFDGGGGGCIYVDVCVAVVWKSMDLNDDGRPLCSLFLDVVMMYLPSCLNSMMKKGLSS